MVWRHNALLVCIIIPEECVAQRREVNHFVQSDIQRSVFILAPAIDQPQSIQTQWAWAQENQM